MKLRSGSKKVDRIFVLFCGSKNNNTRYDNGAELLNKVRPKTVIIRVSPLRFSILIANDVKFAILCTS